LHRGWGDKQKGAVTVGIKRKEKTEINAEATESAEVRREAKGNEYSESGGPQMRQMGPRVVASREAGPVKDTLATMLPKLDSAGVRERGLDVLSGLREELGSHGAVVELSIDSNL